MGAECDEDILRPLLINELQLLLDLYSKRSRELTYHYFTIYNQLKWNEQLEKIPDKDSPRWNRFKRKFYTHRNGNLQENGTFIGILNETVVSVTFHTFEKSRKELIECLEHSKLIYWNSGPLLEGINIDLAPFITETLARLGARIEHDRLSLYFLLDKNKINNLPERRIPDGYHLKQLTSKDAERIHLVWPNKKEGSVDFIRGLIIFNGGFGIFKEGNKELVAWVLKNEFSGIGVLQTVPEEQGKGFATILVVEICKKIVQIDNNDVNAFTVRQNHRSQAILKKLGFEVVEYTKWTKYKRI